MFVPRWFFSFFWGIRDSDGSDHKHSLLSSTTGKAAKASIPRAFYRYDHFVGQTGQEAAKLRAARQQRRPWAGNTAFG